VVTNARRRRKIDDRGVDLTADLHLWIPQLIALGEVVVINLLLSGDNAIVVGMAAATLPKQMRGKVIFFGILAATILRVIFAIVANQILAIVGLTLAGGLLLLWVCWRFWREILAERQRRSKIGNSISNGQSELDEAQASGVSKSMRQAIVQIVIADVSMSLDNVLAVAGAAEQHTAILIVGLLLSVALMGAAASVIAGILKRYHSLAYFGLAIIVWVAATMIYRGSAEVINALI
jgi:YjbE family integral membrane protein